MTRIYMFILLTIILLYSEFASAYDRGDKLLWACNGDESAGANEALGKAHCIGYVSGMLDASILIFGTTGSRLSVHLILVCQVTNKYELLSNG